MGHRVDAYRAALREVLARGDDPRPYPAAHSNLPGPRGNLELAAAAAEELPHATFADLASSADEVRKRRLRQVLVDRS